MHVAAVSSPPNEAIVEMIQDLTVQARLAESLAQQTDLLPRTVCELTGALSRSLHAHANTLATVIAPALRPIAPAVKDGPPEMPLQAAPNDADAKDLPDNAPSE